MDDCGRMWVSAAQRAEFERAYFGKAIDVEPGDEVPPGTLPIDDGEVATRLAGMNRARRRAFMSARRRGASEEDALVAAGGALGGVKWTRR